MATSRIRTGLSAECGQTDCCPIGSECHHRAAPTPAAEATALAGEKGCMARHGGVANRIVGPSYRDVAARYEGRPMPRQGSPR